MSEPTATDRHLAMLDELAQIGLVLARRLPHQHPALGWDYVRDYEIVSRGVRRCILLYHLLETGQLPKPRSAPAAKAESTPAPSAPSGDSRTRLDQLDRLDDVSGPFEHVVASIVRDVQTVLATFPVPADQAPLVQDIIRRELPLSTRHEADAADLK